MFVFKMIHSFVVVICRSWILCNIYAQKSDALKLDITAFMFGIYFIFALSIIKRMHQNEMLIQKIIIYVHTFECLLLLYFSRNVVCSEWNTLFLNL